ncbi:unannotated protein [freshwater metagenome]|uniref:Unannotated protein n=1 Tax=freshwater metagenome TaxID=449393 RepID=A0A6J6XYE1_9ZZZZ
MGTAVIDVEHCVRVTNGSDNVALAQTLGDPHHLRGKSIGDNPIGKRVGNMQSCLIGEILQ